MAVGFGKTIMAGPGSAPILGVGRRIITAAGSLAEADGAGIRDQCFDIPTGRPRNWAISVGAADSEWELASGSAVWVGCLSRRLKRFIPGMGVGTTPASGPEAWRAAPPSSTTRILPACIATPA